MGALHTILVLVRVSTLRRGLLSSPKQRGFSYDPMSHPSVSDSLLSGANLAIFVPLFILCPSHSPLVLMFMRTGLSRAHSQHIAHISWIRDCSKLHCAQDKNIIFFGLSASFFYLFGFLPLSKNY